MLNNRKCYLKIHSKYMIIEISTTLLTSTNSVGFTGNHTWNFCWKPRDTHTSQPTFLSLSSGQKVNVAQQAAEEAARSPGGGE